MIIIYNNFEWAYFQEQFDYYIVSGYVMTCPCPVTGDPIVHDVKIEEIWDVEQNKNLTNVIGHDWIASNLDNRIY